MRILQIGKYSKERPGGVETAVYGLGEELAKTHDVEVLVCSEDRAPRAARSGRLTERVLPVFATLFSTPFVPAMIGRLRRSRGFDIIQVSLQNPMAVVAYLLTRPPGKLVVWYHHDIVRQKRLGFLFKPLHRAFLRKADAIVATSREYAESSPLLTEFREKVSIIPLGIDLESLSRGSNPGRARELRDRFGTPLVLFVGRLVYYKGLSFLIEAMRGLEATLVVVGRGPMEARLRALAGDLGVEQRVKFEDVPHSESLTPYWEACDIGVLPSSERTEAFGLSLLEAMACGKPVVATRLGTGTTAVCEDGATGLSVPPRNPDALREALRRLLDDGALATRFGETGRERVRTRFSLPVMARSFVELYERILGQC